MAAVSVKRSIGLHILNIFESINSLDNNMKRET